MSDTLWHVKAAGQTPDYFHSSMKGLAVVVAIAGSIIAFGHLW